MAVDDGVGGGGDVCPACFSVARGVDCFYDFAAAEPVADVVCVAVVKSDRYTSVEDIAQVLQQRIVDKVTCLLERPVDIVVCIGLETRVSEITSQKLHIDDKTYVVEVNTNRLLN